MRSRPKKIEIRDVDTYRKPIGNPYAMKAFLSDTYERGYLSVYFVRPRDLMDATVKERLSKERRTRLARLDNAALLPIAYQWLRESGGLNIWSTLYGPLERLEV